MAVSSKMLLLAGLGVASLMALPQAAQAAFTCPTPAQPDVAPSVAEVQKLLPATGDALDHIGKLNAAVFALKAQNVSSPLVIDRLIAAYCPQIAANADLNDAEKTMKIRRFAARIVDTVYSLDTASAIIINVPLPPDVLTAAQAKAEAAKKPVNTWIAETVEKALAP